jgi:uncharacterized membrane protein HdeD (DUF308 family)
MNKNHNLGKDFENELKNHYKWLIFSGLLLCILSTCAASIHFVEKKNIISFILFLTISAVILIHSFKFWYKKYIGFFLHLTSAFVYTAVGFYILMPNSLFHVILLYVLFISFLSSGLFRLNISSSQGITYLGWGWTFLCGIVNLVLFFTIIFSLNTTSPAGVIETTSLIDIYFTGLALFGLGLNFQRYIKKG